MTVSDLSRRSGHDRAVDGSGSVAREERDDVSDRRWFDRAGERLRVKDGRILGGGDHLGGDGVDADAVGAELEVHWLGSGGSRAVFGGVCMSGLRLPALRI
jgi:hypothetical protein